MRTTCELRPDSETSFPVAVAAVSRGLRDGQFRIIMLARASGPLPARTHARAHSPVVHTLSRSVIPVSVLSSLPPVARRCARRAVVGRVASVESVVGRRGRQSAAGRRRRCCASHLVTRNWRRRTAWRRSQTQTVEMEEEQRSTDGGLMITCIKRSEMLPGRSVAVTCWTCTTLNSNSTGAFRPVRTSWTPTVMYTCAPTTARQTPPLTVVMSVAPPAPPMRSEWQYGPSVGESESAAPPPPPSPPHTRTPEPRAPSAKTTPTSATTKDAHGSGALSFAHSNDSVQQLLTALAAEKVRHRTHSAGEFLADTMPSFHSHE